MGAKIPHSSFDNVTAREIIAGRHIVERDEKGKVTKRIKVTSVDVLRNGHTHVTVEGGNQWCYDSGARVELD